MADIQRNTSYPYNAVASDNLSVINNDTIADQIDDVIRQDLADTRAALNVLHNNDFAINTELATISALVGTNNTNAGDRLDLIEANGWVTAVRIANDAVTGAKIADSSIGNNHLTPNAVGTSDVQNDAITNDKIASNAVNSDSIADNAVGTNQIANGAVTADKLASGAFPTPRSAFYTAPLTYTHTLNSNSTYFRVKVAGGGSSGSAHQLGTPNAGSDSEASVGSLVFRARGGAVYSDSGPLTTDIVSDGGLRIVEGGAARGRSPVGRNFVGDPDGFNGNLIDSGWRTVGTDRTISITVGGGGSSTNNMYFGQNGYVIVEEV